MNIKAIEDKSYFGRGIALARLKSATFVAYFLSGRSPSSQARRLVAEFERLRIEVTDPAILAQAGNNRALLVYDAIDYREYGDIVVSNGVQTRTVASRIKGCQDVRNPAWRLEYAMTVPDVTGGTEFEPDAPNWTPRITALAHEGRVAFHIVRRGASGHAIRAIHGLDFDTGEGAFLSTYEGPNTNPLPSFRGGPIPIEIDSSVDGNYLADRLWGGMNPEFRVSVAVGIFPDNHERPQFFIRNRHGATK